MSRINACAACSFRYNPIDAPEKVKQCCYETCASFHGKNNVEHTTCGRMCQKCVRIKIPKESVYQTDIKNEFKDCLYRNSDNLSETLRCCLDRCDDFDCQEQCIDGYNALQKSPVLTREPFQSKLTRTHFVLLVVIGGLLYTIRGV